MYIYTILTSPPPPHTHTLSYLSYSPKQGNPGRERAVLGPAEAVPAGQGEARPAPAPAPAEARPVHSKAACLGSGTGSHASPVAVPV
jgi:hypothetical protein